MLVPICLLALGALLSGQLFHGDLHRSRARARILAGHVAFSRELAEAAETSSFWVKLSPTIAMLSGLWIAWNNYIRDPSAPARFVAHLPRRLQVRLNKWYFDELYDRNFRSARAVARPPVLARR